MARKAKKSAVFDGTINSDKDVLIALSELEDNNSTSPEESLALLEQCCAKAYKIIVNSDNPKNAEDMRVEAKIDIKNNIVKMYELKDVVEEDDLEDDFLQISVEDAKLIDPNAEKGTILYIPCDFKVLGEDKKFLSKVRSLYLQKSKEQANIAKKNRYSSLIGSNIVGTVENIEYGKRRITIAFDNDKVNGVIYGRDIVDTETIYNRQRLKCYLKGIDDKKKDLTLILSRSDKNFIRNLFKEHIQEVSEGIITIESVSRVAGIRSKVAVYSKDPNIDAKGSCIGPDGTRVMSIKTEVNDERIDVVQYTDNLVLFIANALSPADVIGVCLNPNGDETKAIAIVKNDGKKSAIGRKGINVKLASQLVGKNIDIKELDEAMKENIKYTSIEDVKREIILDRLDNKEKDIIFAEEYNPEIEEEVEEHFKDLNDVSSNEEQIEEHNSEVVGNVSNEHNVDKNDLSSLNNDNNDEVHIQIRSSGPRVSLRELEAQIDNEKKQNKGNSNQQTTAKAKPSSKKKEKPEAESVVKAPQIMPIYTEEELKAMDEEEEEYEDTYSYDEYDEEYDKY